MDTPNDDSDCRLLFQAASRTSKDTSEFDRPRDNPSSGAEGREVQRVIPPVIHRIWLGGAMPDEYREFGERWAALNPTWTVKTWTEVDLEWLRNWQEYKEANHLSTKANIARYEIVLRHGGMYVDADIEPLKPIEKLFGDASLVLGEETEGQLNNALFAAEAGSPFLEYVVGELPSSFHGRKNASSSVKSGPRFLDRCYRRWLAMPGSVPAQILKPYEIYPYTWDQPHLRGRDFPHAVAVHHWARSWVPSESPREGMFRFVKSVTREVAARSKHMVDRLSERWAGLDGRRAHVSRRHNTVYVGGGIILTNTVEGFPILSLARDLGVTPALVATGTYDPGYHEFMRHCLTRGDVFVDIGANIGLFSMTAGWIVGNTGKVVAYEANPEIHAMLVDSIYMNAMQGMSGSIRAINAAAGDRSGEIELRAPRKHPGRGSTVELSAGGGHVDRFVVESVTLDEELELFSEIKLLKIDVEGAELGVLRGLRRTIESGRIRFLDLELIDEHVGNQWSDLAAELREIRDVTRADTFKLDGRGALIPWSVDAAIHSDRLQHFIFRIPPIV